MDERRKTKDESCCTKDPSFVVRPPSSVLRPSSTAVLGLGNPILCDDGVGWRVVEAAESAWRRRIEDERREDEDSSSFAVRPSSAVQFDCVSLGGLALMERLVGCARAILVDAIQTHGAAPGTLYRLTPGDLPTLNVNAVHDVSLLTALELGRQLGAQLPQDIVIIAVEAERVLDFGEHLSPQVAASVGRAAEMVLAELGC